MCQLTTSKIKYNNGFRYQELLSHNKKSDIASFGELMSNNSYNSLGLSPHDHKVLLKPQVLSAHSRQGQVNIRGVTEPHLNLPFYQKSKIFPRYFQHTSTYISLAKMCLNTSETKKNEYLGTLLPQIKAEFS